MRPGEPDTLEVKANIFDLPPATYKSAILSITNKDSYSRLVLIFLNELNKTNPDVVKRNLH